MGRLAIVWCEVGEKITDLAGPRSVFFQVDEHVSTRTVQPARRDGPRSLIVAKPGKLRQCPLTCALPRAYHVATGQYSPCCTPERTTCAAPAIGEAKCRFPCV